MRAGWLIYQNAGHGGGNPVEPRELWTLVRVKLQLLDWLIVLASLLVCFVPSLFFGKRAGKSTWSFRLGTVGALVAGGFVDGGDDVQQ